MTTGDYVVWRDEQLSKRSGSERYVVVHRQTREVVDNCNGHGYKSAQAAHKSWAYKQKHRGKGGKPSSPARPANGNRN